MGTSQRHTGSFRCHDYRELLPGDVGKRLLIAVYHRDFLNDNNQHLGSMSFGIRDVCQSSSAQVRAPVRRLFAGACVCVSPLCPGQYVLFVRLCICVALSYSRSDLMTSHLHVMLKWSAFFAAGG